jgi:hypothetical protein
MDLQFLKDLKIKNDFHISLKTLGRNPVNNWTSPVGLPYPFSPARPDEGPMAGLASHTEPDSHPDLASTLSWLTRLGYPQPDRGSS